MKSGNILRTAILGIIFLTISTQTMKATGNASGIVDNEPNIPVESLEQYTALINGKEIHLSKELKLSEVFKTLSDPEDMQQGSYGRLVYWWGLECDTGQTIFIEAEPEKNEIADWMVINYENGEAKQIITFLIAGKTRYVTAESLKYIKDVRKDGKPLCPDGLWCSVFNRSKNHGMPFEILEKYDIVGPAIWVTIHNGGLQSIQTSGDPSKDVFLTIITPDGQKHISKLKTIEKEYPQKFDVGRLFQVSIPFFEWVTDSEEKVDVPIGTYRYYATFLGACSRVHEVEVHRRAFVIDSPNSEDEEIVIKPFYDKLPVHRLNYEQLVQE